MDFGALPDHLLLLLVSFVPPRTRRELLSCVNAKFYRWFGSFVVPPQPGLLLWYHNTRTDGKITSTCFVFTSHNNEGVQVDLSTYVSAAVSRQNFVNRTNVSIVSTWCLSFAEGLLTGVYYARVCQLSCRPCSRYSS